MTGTWDPLAALRAAAAARAEAGLARELRPRDHSGPVTDLASNDYLGLATDPRLIEAAAAAAREWGTGATGSRLVTGSTTLHAALESALAEFLGAAGALVFSSGYLANLAAVTALAGALTGPRGAAPSVLVVTDQLNHASLVDACRLARARLEITPHQDVAAVDRALAARAEPAALVVTESVFSAGGPVTPLRDLWEVTHARGALLVVDEAHALGIMGAGGRGVAWEAGIATEPDVTRVVSFGKALGAQGGAVLGAAEVIQTLVSTGRGFIFDTALAPPAAGAALAALDVLRHDPGLAGAARANARRLAETATRAGLPEAGMSVTGPGGAVIRVTVGHPSLAVAARRVCADHGVRVGCFRPPSVPPGESCLRLTARASLTSVDFARAARALTAVRDLAGTAVSARA